MSNLEQVKSLLKSIIISDPQNVTVKKLDQDYRNFEGQPIPFRALGFTSLNNFLESLTDTVTVEGYGMNALVSTKAGGAAHIEKLVASQTARSKTNNNNRRQPERRRFQEQKKNYRTNQHSSNYQHHNQHLHNPVQLQHQMHKNFHQSSQQNLRPKIAQRVPKKEEYDEWNPPGSSKYHNSYATTSNATRRRNSNEDRMDEDFKRLFAGQPDEPVIKVKPANDDLNDDYDDWNPVGVGSRCQTSNMAPHVSKTIGNGVKPHFDDVKSDLYCKFVPKFQMAQCLRAYSTFPVVITNIESPNEFSFQHCKTPELDSLMEEMKNFYSKLSKTDCQIIDLTERQYCCCAVDGLWFRGQIRKVISQDKVEIALIDIGASVIVDNTTKVKYLLDDFGKLPYQAGVGRLYAIQPVGAEWSQEAVVAFHEMTVDKILYAKNIDFRAHEASTKMILIDTTGEFDVEINKLFIRQRFAKLGL